MRVVLIFTLVIISLNLKAQHCRWDGTDVMVIAIKSNANDTISINYLKVMVTDSSGNPLLTNYFINGTEKTNKLGVFQNKIDPNFNVKKVHDLYDVRCFWFAKNNYVLVSSFVELRKRNMLITIEDIDGAANSGSFEKYTFCPDPDYTFPLCSKFSFWESGSEYGFVENFKMVDIILKKK